MAPTKKRTWAGAILLLVIGCGGKSEEEGTSTGGAAGTSGSGGSATGGSAGSGGSATGGSAGSGGSAGGGQCTDSSQCKLFSDCCTCLALGPGDPEPPSCPSTCLQDTCSAMGIKTGQVACAAGQCVIGFDCDATQVFCNALPPKCGAGQVPSVAGGCWGPCVQATECASVPDCTACVGAGVTCVTIDMQGAESATHHCAAIPKGCEANPTCACMGSSLCVSPYSACSDPSGVPGVICSCPNC